MIRKYLHTAIITVALIAPLATRCLAFTQGAHRAISTKTGELSASTIEAAIWSAGIVRSAGIAATVDTVVEHFAEGSFDEDEPTDRVVNHFYNPLNGTGLSVPLFPDGRPAAEWALTQSVAKSRDVHTWSVANERLADAVATGSVDDFALAFKELGHVAHLLQDMASPSHVRNDPHLCFEDGSPFSFICPDPEPDHKYLDEKQVEEILRTSGEADLIRPTDSLAAPGILNLFDTGAFANGSECPVYDLSSPATMSVGIAEIVFTQFYSKNRIPGSYHCPARDQVSCDAGGLCRYQPGLPPGHPVAVERRDGSISVDDPEFILQRQAPITLKTAVGYSKALINHFLSGIGGLALRLGSNGELIVKNNTGRTLINGELQLVVEDFDGGRTLVPGFNVSISLLEAGRETSVTLGSTIYDSTYHRRILGLYRTYSEATDPVGIATSAFEVLQNCGDQYVSGTEECDPGERFRDNNSWYSYSPDRFPWLTGPGHSCQVDLPLEGYALGQLGCNADCTFNRTCCKHSMSDRWHDNGDGTISDFRFGIMYEKKTKLRDGSIHDVYTSFSGFRQKGTDVPYVPLGVNYGYLLDGEGVEFLMTLNDWPVRCDFPFCNSLPFDDPNSVPETCFGGTASGYAGYCDWRLGPYWPSRDVESHIAAPDAHWAEYSSLFPGSSLSGWTVCYDTGTPEHNIFGAFHGQGEDQCHGVCNVSGECLLRAARPIPECW